ncbi:hypothetical protein [Dyadobacter arcticus]|uniref:Uncharacterized protein n=1 Tax=Dyadobacter arcticus TaxID=1078754 RepID=A0ABX0URI0_9BACT|nr:hypothetical protein [Dyadobacter arcticus]NIJ54764.1 hypothetical protein [Dyadobacter arcticus]
MRKPYHSTSPQSIQDSILKGAIASARIEGVVISEKNAQKSLKKVLCEIKKVGS